MTMRYSPGIAAGLCALLLLAQHPARAIEDRAHIEPTEPAAAGRAIAWKLTPGVYTETAARSAFDFNLRGNRENDVFWIGHYQRGEEFQQTRLAPRCVHLGPPVPDPR